MATLLYDNRQRSNKMLKSYCISNVKIFLQETTLHGLKFLADSSITLWERLFFLISFIAAVITTANLISNIYAKWNNTPVIIGISPYPTSILKVPFPAITVCNMNQALRSKVSNYSENSYENALLKLLCFKETQLDEKLSNTSNFRNNNLKITDFVIERIVQSSWYGSWAGFKVLGESSLKKSQIDGITGPDQCVIRTMQMIRSAKGVHRIPNQLLFIEPYLRINSQPCAKMLLQCEFSSIKRNCNDFFHEMMTDEGLCCVFNVLHPYFLNRLNTKKPLETSGNSSPVSWDPETGYPPILPKNYYPRPAGGTGKSMGLTIILDAELDEYYCSSTNGPGFKISLHNPIETPFVKETAITVPIGFETQFRLEAIRSEAMPGLRAVHINTRQCLFINEEQLLFFKRYNRRNCESECEAAFLYENCQCLPYNLPFIFENATVCTAKESFCISTAEKSWLRKTNRTCRDSCFPSCFDITYTADSFSVPLREHNYTIPNDLLRDMPKDYVKRNIAIVHFYYRESIFHGNLKNVYIGLTEFLSNTGGILGLFMGFSVISVAEIIYFTLLRPVFDFAIPQRQKNHIATTTIDGAYNIWHRHEVQRPKSNWKFFKKPPHSRNNVFTPHISHF